MSLTQPQLDALVGLLSESLRARAGEVLSDLVIADRARNAAQLLSMTYRMMPIGEGCESEDGEHCGCWPVQDCCICAAGPREVS